MRSLPITCRRLALAAGLLFSCSETDVRPMDNPIQGDKYFSIRELVDDQIVALKGKRVSKATQLGDQVEKIDRVLDSADWRVEFDIFIQADINKASLANSYDTKETNDEILHTRIEGEPGDVQEMRIQRQNGRVEKVSFSFRKESLFYLSEGDAAMELDVQTGLVSHYYVNGRQKVWFLPANTMRVTGEILP